MSSSKRPSILLVSCYELGRQPLGLSWPLAFLERAGFPAACLDLSVARADEESLRSPVFVAISVPMHTAIRLGVGFARRLRRENPRAHVCFFGHYAWLNVDYLLGEGLADSVIAGEAEGPLVELVEGIVRGGPKARAIPGVSTSVRKSEPHIRRLDLPAPWRDGLPELSRYAGLEWRGRTVPAAAVESSRGCKHTCLHCPITPVYRGRFFAVPAEIVLSDIRRSVAAGARHITFGDADFLNGSAHAAKIARALHREHPDVTFDFTAKIEHLLANRDLLPELRRCGCIFAVSAVESLNDDVLRALDKGHGRNDVFEAVSAVHDAGIALRPSLMPFTPWETLESYLDIIEWIGRDGLVDHIDPVQLSIRLLIPPGSALLERPEIRPFLGDLDPPAFSYRWSHPDPRMDGLCAEVQAVVERAAAACEDGGMTFRAVRALALETAGRGADASGEYELRRARARPPRITEPWFC